MDYAKLLTRNVGIWVMIMCLIPVTSILMAENLSVTLESGDYQIESADNGNHNVMIEGFGRMLIPGCPELPAKVFLIAIPYGADVSHVTIEPIGSVELPGSFDIAPAPPFMPMNNDKAMVEKYGNLYHANYKMTYSSDVAWPEQVGEYIGTGDLRKYHFAKVSYRPFSYHPISQKLIYHPSLNISIEYSLPSEPDPKIEKILSDTIADERASRLLVNYAEAEKWYKPANSTDFTRDESYNYIIVTTEDLVDALSDFVKWKEQIGFSVNVVTTSWIETNYTGIDLPQQIRNFLIDKYMVWGTEYLLIVGNIDVIPMRHCFPDPTDHDPNSDYSSPTDYYYAGLGGDWDSDGDGYYGEYGEDNVEFATDIFVGRIPYSDATTVNDICWKLINTESDMSSWKYNALLLGAMSNFYNEDFSGWPPTDGGKLMLELINAMLFSYGWTYTTMYEGQGLQPSYLHLSGLDDFPLTHDNVMAQWPAGNYGLVNWWAHGGYNRVARIWWDNDDGDNVPESEDPDEIEHEYFLTNTDVPLLNDDYPSIIFSCSCNNGWPEEENLARELLRHGSAGIVASSRVSWYRIGWEDRDGGGNASIDYYFTENMLMNFYPLGPALYNSKEQYEYAFFWWGWQSQQNMFDFNLYGDPSMEYYGVPYTYEPYICGDVNNDELINILDIVYLINYKYKEDPEPLCSPIIRCADVNTDDLINILDIVYLLNYKYKEGSEPVCP